MANLQKRNGSYRILFPYYGKLHGFTIGKVSEQEADHIVRNLTDATVGADISFGLGLVRLAGVSYPELGAETVEDSPKLRIGKRDMVVSRPEKTSSLTCAGSASEAGTVAENNSRCTSLLVIGEPSPLTFSNTMPES